MPPYNKPGRGRGGGGGGGRGGGGGGGGRGGGGGGGGRGGGHHHNNKGHNNNNNNNNNQNNNKTAKDVLATMLQLVFEKTQAQIFANNVLHLANFRACPDLAAVQSSVDFNTKAFCQALCRVIKANCTPAFINIDSNDISTLGHFLEALRENDLHLTLAGLSAANNKIDTLNFVGQLKHFPLLQELRFEGCPVTQTPNYLNSLRRQVPTLLGVDGVAATRPPLALPWPVPPTRTQEMTDFLMFLESNYFGKLQNGGSVDAIIDMYHPNACVTFTTVDFKIECKSESTHKAVVPDLSRFRKSMEDKNRNLVSSQHINRSAIGKLNVGKALTEFLYPKFFRVIHQFDPNANVQPLSVGVKTPLYMTTLHGTMGWCHNHQTAEDKHINWGYFDRTMTLVNADGRWLITNDIIHLRKRHTTDAILVPSAPGRLEKIGKKFGLPPTYVQAATELATSDDTLLPILSELQSLSVEVLSEIHRVCNGDLKASVLTARMVANLRLRPASAFACLQETGGSLDAAVPLANSKYVGPDHRYA